MSVLGAQTFQVQKWPAGGFASRRRSAARPCAARRSRSRTRTRSASSVESVDLVGSEIWDFGFVGRVQGRDHEPEHLDLRRHARVPAEQHALRRARAATSRRWTCAGRAQGGGHRLRDRAEAVPVRGPDRQGDPASTTASTEVVGVFDEKKSAFGGNFDNYVLIPVTTFLNTYGLDGPERVQRARSTSPCAPRRPR